MISLWHLLSHKCLMLTTSHNFHLQNQRTVLFIRIVYSERFSAVGNNVTAFIAGESIINLFVSCVRQPGNAPTIHTESIKQAFASAESWWNFRVEKHAKNNSIFRGHCVDPDRSIDGNPYSDESFVSRRHNFWLKFSRTAVKVGDTRVYETINGRIERSCF